MALIVPKHLPGEISYARTLRVFAALYFLGAVLFFFFPSEWIYLANLGPRVLRITDAMPEPVDHYWCVWAGTQCVTLATLSLLSAESPKVRGYGLAHLLAKLVSAIAFFYFFLNTQRFFIYLLGGTVESLLFILLLWRLLRSTAGKRAMASASKNEIIPTSTSPRYPEEPRIS